jgi:RNA polymerase sigma-54 factor
LLLREVADYLGVHESTISRVTTRKYIHTPQGVFELKHFFSNSLSTYNGQQCAATAIRAFIKDVIEKESMATPLNDNSIARLLNDEKGVYISRRTIAKYRESMAIPPARRRKLCSFDTAQV